MDSAPKRVLIIHPEGNSYNNPSLTAIIGLLLSKGCAVDLRYAQNLAPVPEIPGVRLIPYGKHVRRLKKLILEVLSNQALALVSAAIEKVLRYGPYDLIIGVDRQGLIEAAQLNRISGTPYIFISFEILFEEETSLRYKALERRAARNVSLWVVQDPERASCLRTEDELKESMQFLLPLASEGVGTTTGERLRDQLEVPRDRKVAIMMGSLSKWSMAGQILDTVADWPDEWVLILHERYGRTRSMLRDQEPQLESLLDRKVFLSDTPADNVDELGFILSGISVGLAFYKPDFEGPYWGRNLVHLGLASGKISTYLRYGVPVITNEIGLYAGEIRKNGLGLVVGEPSQISNELPRFHNDDYRNRAQRYFLETLDFSLFRERLWDKLDEAMNPTRNRAGGR